MEDRLRDALTEAGAAVDTATLKPLRAPERRRSWVDLRLVSAAVVVVLAGATTAVWLGGQGDEHGAVLAGPTGGQSEGRELVVFLCSKSASGKAPHCKGQDVTAEQTKAIEKAAKELPGVKSISYVDKTKAFDGFRRDFAHNRKILGAVAVDDLHDSFQLGLERGTDPTAVKQALVKLPGVEDVDLAYIAVPDLSSGPEVSVFLCDDGSEQPVCGAERAPGSRKVTKAGKAATTPQRNEIVALLRASKQVESFVFEDRKTAYENFKRSYGDNKSLVAATRVEDLPESYRLRMRSESDDWSGLLKALRQQRGVASVLVRQCVGEVFALTRYRVTVPESKVCG
ncbi:hypothetical protein DMB42_35290 [Nonomuraea sp. WAC 01424]|uniref:permease-like cell division protein FtsX n=1 Tax=Nonomuraea sp. WAC 01424 TaxID=2203200 RepID=UPI000F7A8991|nr:permease-like cell division protein FtsX [Nonomuraea sp. WAC 01424]RSN03099.1 hypothetical protein DMB42_35290 [Nonomuraea sp. WAC 01424]